MEIKSNEIKIIDIDSIVENPRNPNSHPQEQIIRLSKLIKNTGFRSPLIVSNRSGFLIVGHGRYAAAKLLGIEKLPVIFQDFENEAEEYSFMTADNAIASWSDLNLDEIKMNIEEFEDFDIDMLGIEDLNFEMPQPENYSDKNSEINTENFGNDLEHQCPKCGFEFND